MNDDKSNAEERRQRRWDALNFWVPLIGSIAGICLSLTALWMSAA